MSDTTETTITETPPTPSPKTKALMFSETALIETAADGAVNVTLLRPGWSKNDRFYSKEAIARAVPKFEGAQAYIDHPSKDDEKNRPERSVRDLAGYYTNVHQSPDGAMKATFNPVGANGDFLKPLIAATAEKPDLLGLSINAAGSTVQGEAEGRKGILVEDITRCLSTDIVTRPAAGGKFETLRASDDELTSALLEAMGYDEWREARPAFLERLKREYRDGWRDDAVKTAEAQAKTLRETIAEKDKRIKELEEAAAGKDMQIANLSAENTRRDMQVYADRLIAESRLPSAWQPNKRAQLLSEANTGNWPGMVAGWQTEYSAVRPPIAVHGAGIAGMAVRESMDPWVLPDESPEQYAARKRRISQRS